MYLSIPRLIFVFVLFSNVLPAIAQQHIDGIIADAGTHEALPFATVRAGDSRSGLIADIHGRFSIDVPSGAKEIQVSFIGYEPKNFPVANRIDTFFLHPLKSTIGEVVIKPPYDKIRRLVNLAVEHKDDHDPDKYDWYRCHIYYQMMADYQIDAEKAKASHTLQKIGAFEENSHILFTETYSERIYHRPQQVQENVIASRFSGLKKTYFTNLITNVLPFDVYKDFIKLNNTDYLHPIAKGWQSRYEFDIVDEVVNGNDTTFILKYRPKKNVHFNSLRGAVYINSNGYAISHFTATTDTSEKHYTKMEQVYRRVNDRWFPRELNYELVFKNIGSLETGLILKGHSIIDSVSYTEPPDFHFDKAKTVKLSDSVDLHTPEQWRAYRFDTLAYRSQNTYRMMDSIGKEAHLDDIMNVLGKSFIDGIPVKFISIELPRLISRNQYEGIRLGLGIHTNDRVSKYFSVGGWFGHGLKDEVLKYGGNLKVYPWGDKDNWLDFAYQNNYKSTGSINFHPDLDNRTLRQWLLSQVDQVEEYSFTAHKRLGYWEVELNGLQQQLTPRYTYSFTEPGSAGVFDVKEGSVGLRFAFAEKRSPAFGFYFPEVSKYPIVYVRLSGGNISSGTYETNYYRALAAITWSAHINRWGKDNFRIEGGYIKTTDDKGLMRSFLLAGNGYKMPGRFQLYAWGGFMTMLPYQFFSDKYASLLYMHDFDKRLYKLDFSNPYISLAHNILLGNLSKENMLANPGMQTPSTAYNESGIILNSILRYNFADLIYLNINLGAFYHWTDSFDAEKNGRLALGFNFTL